MTHDPYFIGDRMFFWITVLLWAVVLAVAAIGWVTMPKAHASEGIDVERIVDAIYLAEGGAKTRHPFGILSVKCVSYEDCRRICHNTVRNNYRRWEAAGAPGEYLEFLARRYAPVGAANDPTGLNRHWLRNVRSLLDG